MYNYVEGNNKFQPREKAQKYGLKNLSDRELLAIILGSGIKGNPVEKLSLKILRYIDNSNGEVKLNDLKGIKGIGAAKASVICAALEFSRRKLSHSPTRVSNPSDILPSVRHYVTRAQEYFIVIYLNGAHEIIKTTVVSIGILNRTLIHPREVFSDAIKERAASIILSHNHPSGNLDPSPEDIEVTKRLIEAGKLLGINILDHIIFSINNYFSFMENNLINSK